jgi:hypothetical protein
LFLSTRKYDLGFSSRIRIPNPDPEFLLIPDPGIKKALGPGSATLAVTLIPPPNVPNRHAHVHIFNEDLAVYSPLKTAVPFKGIGKVGNINIFFN